MGKKQVIPRYKDKGIGVKKEEIRQERILIGGMTALSAAAQVAPAD